MMNFITLLVGIFAIIITMYASEDLREKAKKNKNSLLQFIFESLDKFFFNSIDFKNNVLEEKKETDLENKTYFSLDNPLYKYLELDTPIWKTEAQIYFIDLQAINNPKYGEKLLNMSGLLLVGITFFSMTPFLFVFLDIRNGHYFEAFFHLILLSLFLFLHFKAINKIDNYLKSLRKATFNTSFNLIFTKKYLYDTRYNTFYRMKSVQRFEAECSEKEDKLFIYTDKKKSILLHYPIFYKDKLHYQLNFKEIANELNIYLKNFK